MQAKSPAGRDKIIDRIVHAEYQGPVCAPFAVDMKLIEVGLVGTADIGI
jgi:hypothetical protein